MKKNKIPTSKLITEMLNHVPFDGWTWNALYRAAEDIRYYKDKLDNKKKDDLRSLFKNDLVEVIKQLNIMLDNKMISKFSKINSKSLRTPEKIKKLIIFRIQECIKYKESIRSSLGFMSLPQNSKTSLLMLYRTCDEIWRVSGDTSNDFSFYTKRLILSGVYTSTLLFWINEDSNNFENTEKFLDRRLKNVSSIGKIKKVSNDFFMNESGYFKNALSIFSNFSRGTKE